MRLVGALNFGNSSSLSSKAKRSCSQSYPHALSANPTVGKTACTCVLDSLYSPWDDALPHWWCPILQQVDCERSAASTIFSQRLVLNVQNRSKMQHFGRVRSVSCHTSCESVVHCTAFLHHFRSQATKRTRRRTPWMSELSSRLLKSLLYEDLSSKTMSAAGDLSAAAQHLPDVERRRCWSILEAGFLSLIPSPYAKRPEKRWLCTRGSSFCWEKRVAVEALLLVMAPFRTEAVLTVLHRNDPPWPRQDSVVSNSPPRATRNGLARSATIRSLKVEWTSHARVMKHARDRSRKRARTQWARMPLILKQNLKLPGGFIGNGEPPLCTRLWHVLFNSDLWWIPGKEQACISDENRACTIDFKFSLQQNLAALFLVYLIN